MIAFLVPLWAHLAAQPFRFNPGDRVVLLGDTLIERAQEYGFLEAVLTLNQPDAKPVFRNMGWSADTVDGQSRASFNWTRGSDQWRAEMLSEIARVDPSLVILGYGMAHSFQGESALDDFRSGLSLLVDQIQALNSAKKVGFIFLSPVPHESLGEPWPDPSRHNRTLELYAEAVNGVALDKGGIFVSLFKDLKRYQADHPMERLTDNGIHLNKKGYRVIAEIIGKALGLDIEPLISFEKENRLDDLLAAIEEKNELFFHRWRPQNETYLFGFRKHEQGQNAREIPMFDPLIQAAEQQIWQLAAGSGGSYKRVVPPEISKGKTNPHIDQGELDFALAEGVEITLFAENPMLAKPIHMNFDPEGRLWVATSSVYPQIQPGQEASDAVILLEDRDRDGVAEHSSIFAEGLLIPTGVAQGDGGVYVGQSTQLLFFKDTDGDGRADERRIVLSGFGTEDTHHIVHTLDWGMDGRLYFNQSIYIHSHIETPHGVRRLNSGGIWRLDTRDLSLEVFLRGFCNPWGHAVDAFGQSFVTDGAGFQGVSYGIPGAMYFTYAGAKRTLKSISPGSYPKFAGLEIIRTPHFPEDWQGDMITCDFRAHRVVRFKPNPIGAGYITREMPDVIRTENVAFRPIDVKLGPDGALYIADWSNPIIQHGEVDFRDPRRDQTHGRIWRVAFKNRLTVEYPDYGKLDNKRLFDLLLSNHAPHQRHAKRVLTERGGSIIGDLNAWSVGLTKDLERLNALWMYQAVRVVNEPLLDLCLNAGTDSVRVAAVRVLSHWMTEIDQDPHGRLAGLIADPAPQVRVEAVRALGRLGTPKAAALVLGCVDYPMDDFLEYAVWLSVNELSDAWLASLTSGEWDYTGKENQLEYALKSIDPSKTASVLDDLLAAIRLDPSGRGPWIDLVGNAGGTKELSWLLSQAAGDTLNPEGQTKALIALRRAVENRRINPGQNNDPTLVASLATLLGRDSEPVQAEAIRLVGQLNMAPRFQSWIRSVLLDPNKNVPLKTAALQCVSDSRDLGFVDLLRSMMEGINSQELRHAATLTFINLAPGEGVQSLIALMSEWEDENQLQDLWRSAFNIKGVAAEVTRSLPLTGFNPVAARVGLKVAREGGRQDPELLLALARSGGLETAAVDLTEEEMKWMADKALRAGDPQQGEAVYRRPELGCLSCHAIGGAGGKVGPDLTSIGASAPVDYLIESLYYPNRKIKEGYHSVLLETRDDEVLSGIFLGEDESVISLMSPANETLTIPKTRVVGRMPGGSLMPSGLIDYLPEKDRLDLFHFLSLLGKPGPFDASKGNVARVWRVLPATHRVEQFGMENVLEGRWDGMENVTTVLSLVDGRLMIEDVRPALKFRNPNIHPVGVFLMCQMEVASSDPLDIRFSGAVDYDCWIDGRQVARDQLKSIRLDTGSHGILFRLDPKDLLEFVMLRADGVSFPAK